MDKIAVLDFGGQYAHLIANRIRRLKVYSEIRPAQTYAKRLEGYKGIILSGGPQSVYDPDAPKCDRRIFNLGIPILGICYGHQLMTKSLGGKVKGGKMKEYGLSELMLKNKTGVLEDIDENYLNAWMSHVDEVTQLPPGFEVLGSTNDCEYAAIADLERQFYGLQFHPEVTHTQRGMDMLQNFVKKVCECGNSWNMDNYLEAKILRIQSMVDKRKVFMLVSGGVDSTVAFVLLTKALGPERVYGLFVDTGLLRMNEREEVEKSLKELNFQNLHVYDATHEFLHSLREVFDPEAKRKIIGNKFLSVQKRVAFNLNLNPREWVLGQGTIYPDTIETGGTKHADTIKTHHNRVAKIQELIKEKRLIEPVRALYKDEVRELGEKLGLPKEMVWRHPFPGPGLAVRCLCLRGESYPKNYLELEREINMVLADTELRGKVLPVKSVGVQGDMRTYKHPVALYGDASWDDLEQASTRITNQFKEINRVVYLISPNGIENVEARTRSIAPDRVKLLQEADKIVRDKLLEKGMEQEVWQFPVVLMPVVINGAGEESVVLRPVESEEAMTANFAKLDLMAVHEMAKKIVEIEQIGAVFYDITNKPPGTIEWE